MKRRTVLAGAGIAVAGLGGCAGEPDRDGRDTLTDGSAASTPARDGSESTRTDEAAEQPPAELEPQRVAVGESTTVAGGTSLTVTDPAVQGAIVAYNPEFLSIEREEGVQFVVAGVEGDADVEPSSFVVEHDGSVQSPPQTQRYVRSVVRECGGVCVGIPVEVGPAESVALAYRSDGEVRAAWELDGATVDAFSNVPDLRLRDAVVTDENGDVGVEFSVDNVGERGGLSRPHRAGVAGRCRRTGRLHSSPRRYRNGDDRSGRDPAA